MKKKICNIITMVLAVLAVVTLFLPLIKINLSSITGDLDSFFGDLSLWDGVSYSTVGILGKLAGCREELGKYFWLFVIYMAVQIVVPVVIFAASWMKGKAAYILNAVLGVLGAVSGFVFNRVLIPSGIEKIVNRMIDSSIAGEVLDLFNQSSLTDVFASEAGKAYVRSLTVGFYASLGLMVLIVVVSIVGAVLCKETSVPVRGQDPVTVRRSNGGGMAVMQKQPGITGISGVFKGASIPLQRGEELVIGRDASQCSLIIEATPVSRKHCTISYDHLTGQYRVTDYSSNGTYINSTRRIMRNQPALVKSGEVISIGNDENSFRMN